jgi:hypothetical protein
MGGQPVSGPARVVIGLSAVVVAAGPQGPEVLLSRRDGALGLPFGSFDPVGHRTFELAVRDFVTAQTGFALGYVEQLYTFGDLGREAPLADMGDAAAGTRVVSIGYLALAGGRAPNDTRAGVWMPWRAFFPWEDRRTRAGEAALDTIAPALLAWAKGPGRRERVELAFGLNGRPWHEERVLERYETLYEAGLVMEARHGPGRARRPLCGGRSPGVRPPAHSGDRHRAAARQDQIPADHL